MPLIPIVLALGSACTGGPDPSAAPPEPLPVGAAAANPAANPAGAAPGSPAGAGTDPAPAAATIPLYEPDRIYTREELQRMSLRELSLRRNTIYARVGNPFNKKWLRDYFAAQPWYRPAEKADLSRLSDTDRKNAELIGAVEASFYEEDLKSRAHELAAAIRAGSAKPEDHVELDLISTKLGEWQGDPDTPVDHRNPLADPRALERELRPEQLSDLSRRDLRLLRNTIFARRGREFDSELLQMWFSHVAWYTPDPRYTDDRLTDLDRKNIAAIVTEENRRGGMLTDADDEMIEMMGLFTAA